MSPTRELNDSTAVENPLMLWSTSVGSSPPLLSSERCSLALTEFFSDPAQLAVATEASSHPSGVLSLSAQPYVYAGGGLGNMEECPLSNCLAGPGMKRDSITFASVCMVPQCTALDLASDDFTATLDRVSDAAQDQTLAQEYVSLVGRVTEINKFLGTGWTCGNFEVPWQTGPAFAYGFFVAVLVLSGSIVTVLRARARRYEVEFPAPSIPATPCESMPLSPPNDDHERLADGELAGLLESFAKESNQLDAEEATGTTCPDTEGHPDTSPFDACAAGMLAVPSPRWCEPFDLSEHIQALTKQHSPETACLDGLRVGSIFWIVLGHVMAIVSSSGAGYSNPAQFLPPTGLTTTMLGQLLFSSRFAVDTFFVISGFLVVHVLSHKLPLPRQQGNNATILSVFLRYMRHLPALLLNRVVRIFPVYALTLGFYTLVAPHLGEGPFWFQWLGLLKPCHDYAWSNFLFINNFVPFDLAITDTCFYHSWYLAVDMQLFLAAPLLIFWYQASKKQGMIVTVMLWFASVGATTYLTYVRHWSINTFDGAAVARFDVEAYAKPHIRAQSYLAGMFLAMLLPASELKRRSRWTLRHSAALLCVLASIAFVTFITANGAYSQRPCQYKEWPHLAQCGSLWSTTATILYTSLSRTVWVIGVAVLLHLCLGRQRQLFLSSILSWKCWMPLSHLSFGVYLIHPIVIFVWQLGDMEKRGFRLLTFGMDYLSVCVVSYGFALLAWLFVEIPCAKLWKQFFTMVSPCSRVSSDATQQPDDRPETGALSLGDPLRSDGSRLLAAPTPVYGSSD